MAHIHEKIVFTVSIFAVGDRKVLFILHKPLKRWLSISVLEIFCALALVVPALYKPWARWAPWAAGAETRLTFILRIPGNA